LGGGAKAARPM